MWSAINPNPRDSKRTSNLKQLKLVPSYSNNLSQTNVDYPLTTETVSVPVTWRKELRLTTVVERQRKKLSTATASSSSTTYTSYSHSSSRLPSTPFDLPRIDHRLCDLDEKLEVIENMMAARQHLFETLSKDPNILNRELQKELQRNSHLSLSRPSSQNFGETQQHQSNETPKNSQEPPRWSSQTVTAETSQASSLGWSDYFLKKIW